MTIFAWFAISAMTVIALIGLVGFALIVAALVKKNRRIVSPKNMSALSEGWGGH